MGGVGGLLGGQFGRWAGSLGGAVIQGFKVTSPLLQGFIGGTLGGGLGSGLTGFTMSLINGNSLGDAFDAGVEQAKFGFEIGAVAGTSSAYAHSKANGINPVNGRVLVPKTENLLINDILDNPQLLNGKSINEVKNQIGSSEGWINDVMRRSTSNPNGGWILREVNGLGTDFTGRMIQYHPGTLRHFNGAPYWKVSNGSTVVRVPVN
jgi:hypothetical protein